MKLLSRLLARAANWTSVLAGLAVVAMMLQVTLDVTLRYLIGKPLMGTLTMVSFYYMVIVAFVPLALADLIGLDTTLAVAESMYEEFKEPLYAPPALLSRMVEAGLLGRKTGRGFYDYSH